MKRWLLALFLFATACGVPVPSGYPVGTVSAPPRNWRTMFFGDSVTAGAFASIHGYRQYVLDYLATQGLTNMTEVGRVYDGSLYHEGYGGYGIVDVPASGVMGITEKLPGAYAADTPDIVVLLIGYNVLEVVTTPTQQAYYGALLDLLFSTRPGVYVIAALLSPQVTSDSLIVDFNARILPEITSRMATNPNLSYVDYHTATFVANKVAWTYDGLHPNDLGYAYMTTILGPEIARIVRNLPVI